MSEGRPECQRRLQREALSLIAYIQEQSDMGRFTRHVLVTGIQKIIEEHNTGLAEDRNAA